MRLKEGDIIKHTRSLDVCYLVAQVDGDVISCHILNQGFTRTYSMDVKCSLDLKDTNTRDWLVCTEPKKLCLREAKWSPLDALI